MSASLEVTNLRKTYGQITAVPDFSYSFPAGKVTAVVGPSGSGKTSVLSMIAGLLHLDGGSVLLDGRDLSSTPAESRDFGVVFQNYLLFPHLTVRENVEFGLRVRHVERHERRRKASEVLEKLGLGPLSERRVQAISGGEAQRVAVGRALAFGPRVLLLDEPLSALDAQLRESLRGELRRLLSELAITTLYVTHDQAEALSMADDLVILHQGRIQQTGRPLDVYSKPANPFVAGFLGAANVLPGVCRDLAGTREIELSFARLPVSSKTPLGPSWVVLRPEDLQFAGESDDHFEGTVESSTFMGAFQRVHVCVRGGRLSVDLPNDLAIRTGLILKLRAQTNKMAVIPADGPGVPRDLATLSKPPGE